MSELPAPAPDQSTDRPPVPEPDGLADEPPAVRRRRASMSRSRGMGVVGFGVGAAAAAIFGWSPWIAGVVGFIVFAELPDVVYRVRAKRGHTGPLLPDWDPSEAYLVTLRRWRRARSGSPDGSGSADE